MNGLYKFLKRLNFTDNLQYCLYALPFVIVLTSSFLIIQKGEPKGFSHVLGFFFLWVFSFFIWSYLKQRILNFNSSFGIISITTFLQIILIFLLQVYSEMYHFIGFPFAIFFVSIIVLTILVFLFTRLNVKRIFHNKTDLTWSIGLFSMISVSLLWFELSEIPRMIPLSLDPDIHTFHTKQILRFACIPWEQEYWGNLPLNYPIAFASLNSIWAFLSNQDPRNTVVIQPTIQTLLGLGVLIELVLSFRTRYKWDLKKILVFLIMMISFFCVVFPYGHQIIRFHLDGTARLASISFYSLLLTLSSIFIYNNAQYKDAEKKFYWAVTFSFTTSFLLLLNPSNILPILIVSSPCLIYLIYKKINIPPVTILVAIIIVLLVIFLDPYYFNFLNKDKNTSIEISLQNMNNSWSIVFKNYLSKIIFLDDFPSYVQKLKSDFFFLGNINNYFLLIFVNLCFLFIANFFHKKEFSKLLRSILIISISLGIVSLLFSPLFDEISKNKSQFRLLYPYSVTQLQQFISILFCLFILVIVFFIFELNHFKSILFFCILIYISALVIKNDNHHIAYHERVLDPGDLGSFPSNGDIQTIKYIENRFTEYLLKNKNNLRNVPKILIPNRLMHINKEKWLVPFGAVRILFAYNVFPLAFFYYQADKDYTFENYKSNVCDNFNIEWLKSKNIKYLFIPNEFSGCIANFEEIIKKNKILFSKGNSKFIEFNFEQKH